jgi:hypothetical protein
VAIPQGRELDDGYVVIAHGCRYTLHLSNHSDDQCDAAVSIDGQPVGAWPIDPRSTATIERPVHDQGRFTFYALGSAEAFAASLVENDVLGLIQVTFTPEERHRPHQSHTQILGAARVGGGTGLSGQSEQEFSIAAPLLHDAHRAVTINLRLVAEKAAVRPLTQPRMNAIPPRIHDGSQAAVTSFQSILKAHLIWWQILLVLAFVTAVGLMVAGGAHQTAAELIGGIIGTLIALLLVPAFLALIPYGISAVIGRKMSTRNFMALESGLFGVALTILLTDAWAKSEVRRQQREEERLLSAQRANAFNER